ncbi:RNA-binding protein [Streptomyces sp. NPDC050738]|uniref:RNA-binding protein n=1 Tax=Streptomyces sp. NPDC050738 TaxID=3154744 RepID=UPI003445406E
MEAAYLQAVAALATATGVSSLTVREPGVAGFVHFGLEPAVEGYGSAFCVLEAEGLFDVHVGWDQYVYVSSTRPSTEALDEIRALGLFPERIDASPYDTEDDDDGEQRPADDDFWARVRYLCAGRALLLEEGYVSNASRWHRLTHDSIDAVRAQLAPRARLTVWPDLSPDVPAVLDSLPPDDLVEFVWEDENGHIGGVVVDDTQYAELTAVISGARAAAVMSMNVDDRPPSSPRSCPTTTVCCAPVGGQNPPRATGTGPSSRPCAGGRSARARWWRSELASRSWTSADSPR